MKRQNYLIEGLYIGRTKNKGRGIFAHTPLKKNLIIEIAPVIVMSQEDRLYLDKTLMHDYIFEWGSHQDECCMALGYVPLYNHSYKWLQAAGHWVCFLHHTISAALFWKRKEITRVCFWFQMFAGNCRLLNCSKYPQFLCIFSCTKAYIPHNDTVKILSFIHYPFFYIFLDAPGLLYPFWMHTFLL